MEIIIMPLLIALFGMTSLIAFLMASIALKSMIHYWLRPLSYHPKFTPKTELKALMVFILTGISSGGLSWYLATL